jgi:hypothetical protein
VSSTSANAVDMEMMGVSLGMPRTMIELSGEPPRFGPYARVHSDDFEEACLFGVVVRESIQYPRSPQTESGEGQYTYVGDPAVVP